jgi:hypothetical protein
VTSPVQQGGPPYQVIGVSAGQYQTDGAGNPQSGRLVHYQLADGTQDQVFVPDVQWDLGSAQVLIEAAVQRTWDVRQLSRGMGS